MTQHPQYNHGQEVWLVEAPEKLYKLFQGLGDATLPAIHALAVSRTDFERAWGMLRMLCGIRLAIEQTDANKPLSKARVAEVYSTDADELDLTIGYLQAAWNRLIAEADMPNVRPDEARRAKSSSLETPSSPGSETGQSSKLGVKFKFSQDQLALLDLGGFSTKIFDLPVSDRDRLLEVEWFCEQIRDVRKVFEEPMAKELAKQALLNALHIRRVNDDMVKISPTSPSFAKTQKAKDELEERYAKQWAQVAEHCPVAAASATRKMAINNLSDIVQAYRDWKSDPANRNRDGQFTDDELQIQFRASVQTPDPMYRFGLTLAMNEAKIGIGDPKWKRQMTKAQCKILDASTQYAIKKLSERFKIHKPDLEDQGPKGEYDKIHTVADGEITDHVFEEAVEAEVVPSVEIAN